MFINTWLSWSWSSSGTPWTPWWPSSSPDWDPHIWVAHLQILPPHIAFSVALQTTIIIKIINSNLKNVRKFIVGLGNPTTRIPNSCLNAQKLCGANDEDYLLLRILQNKIQSNIWKYIVRKIGIAIVKNITMHKMQIMQIMQIVEITFESEFSNIRTPEQFNIWHLTFNFHHHHHNDVFPNDDNKKSPVDHILPGPNLHIVSHLFNSFFLLCFETRNMFFSFSITSSWDTIVGNILSCEKLYANHKPQMDGFSPLFPGKRRQQDFLEVSVDMALKVKLKLKMQMPWCW